MQYELLEDTYTDITYTHYIPKGAIVTLIGIINETHIHVRYNGYNYIIENRNQFKEI